MANPAPSHTVAQAYARAYGALDQIVKMYIRDDMSRDSFVEGRFRIETELQTALARR